MKILQVVSHYVPSNSFGGVLQTAHMLGKSLKNINCDIRVCTTNMRTHDKNLSMSSGKLVSIDGVNVIYCEVKERSPLRRWGFSASMLPILKEQVKWADIVLLHFHYQYATWMAALLCRFYHCPYLIFTHGSLNKRAINASGTEIKKKYMNILESKNFKKAQYIAYQSKEEMSLSLEVGNSIIIPNGINPDDYSDLPPPGTLQTLYPQLQNKYIFLYLGRLDPNKGLDLLIRAFSNCVKNNPDLHLLLAGPDERGYKHVLESLSKNNDVLKNITFTGYISGETKLAVLRDCNAFVLPSRYEGLSNAMLEALYNGLPVITTPFVGLSQLLHENKAALITDLDVHEITSKMDYLVRNPNEAKKMGKRGHNLVGRELLWDNIAKSLYEVLSDIT